MPRLPHGRPQNLFGEAVALVDATSSINSIMVALHGLETQPQPHDLETQPQPHELEPRHKKPRHNHSLAWQTNLVHSELYKFCNIETMYGPICRKGPVVGITGSQLEVYFASPFAFLSYACSRSVEFFNLLASIMAEFGAIDSCVQSWQNLGRSIQNAFKKAMKDVADNRCRAEAHWELCWEMLTEAEQNDLLKEDETEEKEEKKQTASP